MSYAPHYVMSNLAIALECVPSFSVSQFHFSVYYFDKSRKPFISGTLIELEKL